MIKNICVSNCITHFCILLNQNFLVNFYGVYKVPYSLVSRKEDTARHRRSTQKDKRKTRGYAVMGAAMKDCFWKNRVVLSMQQC